MTAVSVNILPPLQSVPPVGETWSIWESAVHLVGEHKYGWLALCIVCSVLSGGLFVIGDLIGKGVRCITTRGKTSDENQKIDMKEITRGVKDAGAPVTVEAHVTVVDAHDEESAPGDDEDGELNQKTRDTDDGSLPLNSQSEREDVVVVDADKIHADTTAEESIPGDDEDARIVHLTRRAADFKTKKEQKLELDEKSVLRVQGYFRGRAARINYKKMQAANKERLGAAAGLVQTLAKSIDAQDELRALKDAQVEKVLKEVSAGREQAARKEVIDEVDKPVQDIHHISREEIVRFGVLMFQSIIRMHQAKTEFQAKQYIANRFGQNFRRFKRFQAQLENVKKAEQEVAEKRAAIVAQSFVRCINAKAELNALKAGAIQKEQEASTTIARFYKQRKLRKGLMRFVVAAKAEEEKAKLARLAVLEVQSLAAVKLQAFVRMKQAKVEFEKIAAAAKTIQTYRRGQLARRNFANVIVTEGYGTRRGFTLQARVNHLSKIQDGNEAYIPSDRVKKKEGVSCEEKSAAVKTSVSFFSNPVKWFTGNS